MPRDDERREKNIRCSFCHKTQSQVDRLIAGEGVYICNECVELCQAIIEEESAGYNSRKKKKKDIVLPSPMEIKKRSR